MIIKIKWTITLLLFILISNNVTAQNNSITDKIEVYKKEKFPEDWIGNYKGNLQIYSVDSIAMKLEMKLNIY